MYSLLRRYHMGFAAGILVVIVMGSQLDASVRHDSVGDDVPVERGGEILGEKYQANNDIIGVVLPHHMLMQDEIETVLAKVADTETSEIVLIAPLHNGAGIRQVLGTSESLEYLSLDHIGFVDQTMIEDEHAIADMIPLLVSFYPEADIYPIAISNYVPKVVLDEVITKLGQIGGDRLLVASIDFSHFLPTREAYERDEITLSLLRRRDYDALLSLDDTYLDGRGALYVFLNRLAIDDADRLQIHLHTNSGEVLREESSATTSHLYLTYRR